MKTMNSQIATCKNLLIESIVPQTSHKICDLPFVIFSISLRSVKVILKSLLCCNVFPFYY